MKSAGAKSVEVYVSSSIVTPLFFAKFWSLFTIAVKLIGFHTMHFLFRCQVVQDEFQADHPFPKSFFRMVVILSWLMSSSVSIIFTVSRQSDDTGCRTFFHHVGVSGGLLMTAPHVIGNVLLNFTKPGKPLKSTSMEHSFTSIR